MRPTTYTPTDPAVNVVYLLHFEPAYRHAGHYVGFAQDLGPRLNAHLHGRGARLTQVAHDAGCALVLARVWTNASRADERRLKRWHGAAQLCPICRGELGLQLALLPGCPPYIPQDDAQEN